VKCWLILCMCTVLWACSGNQEKSARDPQVALLEQWPGPLGHVDLRQSAGALDNFSLLDIGLVIFDPGVPLDAARHSKEGIFPEIRKAEARYLPYLLRQALVKTEAWGAVRVLPKPDTSSELLLTGKILHSDGMRLVLQMRATDASGRVWIDQVYHDEAGQSDYPVELGEEPYADIYRKITNDLLALREQLSRGELETVRNVALLQYASGLSPDAFADFVSEEEDGSLAIRRLPSQDDPMLARVRRIQNQEYRFIDNADEQYLTLYDEMTPTYNLWRQNGRELAIYKAEYEARVASREPDGQRGTFAQMQQTYNTYKRAKEHDQDLDEIAEGFNNEVAPTVMEIEGKVFRLNGSLEAQYSEWRSILRSIFSLETGLPLTGDNP
jgi:hypothetical protein